MATAGLNMTVELGDQAGLLRRFGDHQNILLTELRQAETGALKVMRDRAKADTSEFSTILPQSIQYEPGANGLIGKIGSVAKTALSIHEGRKPGNAPSYEQLQTWLSRRGNTFDILTHKALRHQRTRLGKKLRDEEFAALRAEAIIVQKKIFVGGSKGHPTFIIAAAQETLDQVQAIFRDHIERALRKLAAKS